MKTAKLSDLVGRLGERSEPLVTPDADLLDRFLADRDAQAFATLVRRHGPLVYGVCRRVTGDHHLAEDAFQAVFVVLAAKAGSVRPRSALPSWLYGVAHRVALRARTMSDRRRRRETPVETVPERASPVVDGAEVADLVAVLDEEIARLPEYQRVPVVVCELEGRSRQEAAAQLGISEGTLSSRLARARKALAARLRRRGIAPSAAGLTAALAQLASGGVPNELVSKAVACAIAPGPVPAAVAALSHGALRVMFVQKLKVLALALAVASGLLASALFAAERLTAAPPAAPVPVGFTEPEPSRPDQPPPKPPAEKPLAQGPNKLLLLRRQGLVLIDPDRKNEKKLTENRETYGEARLSPDGKKIAVLVRSGEGEAQKQTLYVRALDEKEPGTDLGVACDTFVWSPDGSEIACTEFSVGVGPGTFSSGHFVVDVKTREKKPLKMPDDHLLTDWSRDGKFFLTTRLTEDKEKPEARQARLYLVSRDGTEHKAISDGKQYCALGRLSPDGKRVLHSLVTWPKGDKARPKMQLAVLDGATGTSTVVGDTPPNGEVLGYCWSPDGTRIAYLWCEIPEGKEEGSANKETESRLVVCDPDGKNARTIASEKGRVPFTFTLGMVDWR